MFDLLQSIGGVVRWIFLFLDSIGLTFIDNGYNLMVGAMTAFDQEAISQIAGRLTNNCYIIVGIFALFRLALLLINSIITPEKLTEEKNGLGNVVVNLIITIVLFIAVPFVFDKAWDLQRIIVNNNYIPKLIIGKELTSSGDNANAGTYIKDIAVRSLIYPDEKISKIVDGQYVGDEDKQCDSECMDAIEAWTNDVSLDTLNDYIASFVKTNKYGRVFVYKYTPIVTLIVGGFITYVLFSFAIDIIIKTLELVALQILAPLFIITFVDPKSADSGTFKRWLTACGKTYVSLFIKIVIICLMLLFVSQINTLISSTSGTSGMLKLLILIGILIFAKKAPKWIGDLLGIEGGFGELGIGKKLGGMALAGGLASSAIGAGKKFMGQKAKNFGANRLRNTAARVGAMKETHKANREAKKNGTYKKSDNTSLWKQGRAAAKESRKANWGKDAQGFFKDIGGGFMSGRLNVNDEAKSLKAKTQEKAEKSAREYNEKIGNSEADKALRAERAANKKEAIRLHKDVAIDSKTGDRLQVTNKDGKKVYVNPRGNKEMNEALGNPTTEYAAYEAYGTNLAQSKGLSVQNGNVIDTNGKVIATAQEYGMSNMTYAGQLAIKSLVADNVKDTVTKYTNSKEQVVKASQDYSQAVIQYNQAVNTFNNDPNVQRAVSVITKYENITNDPKFVELANKDRSTLTQEEQVELGGYLSKLDSMQADYSKAQSEYDSAKESYGIKQIKINLDEAQKRVEDWSKEVSKLENKMNNSTSPVIDDNGKIKKDSSGNVIKENPYTVEVNGEKLSPVDNFVRINEIQNMLNIKASKAKSKYDDAMKEPDSGK